MKGGGITVAVNDQKTILEEKDFLFVNPFYAHDIEIEDGTLAIRFLFNQDLLSTYYDISKIEFSGDSTKGHVESYQSLQALLENCVTYYYGKQSKDGRSLLKLNSLYYQIAEQIISSYTVVSFQSSSASGEDGDELLIQNIMRYMQLNFQTPLKLEELANQFFLSTSYLSRFFKKKTGINFGKYLVELRLEAAERELKNTKKSLTHIAMDSGFSNLNAMNKAFQEKFDMSPKQFRETLQDDVTFSAVAADNFDNSYRLLDYFEQNIPLIEQTENMTEQVVANVDSYVYLSKPWNRIINIGKVSMLLQTVIQDHVLFLQKELDFEYVRVWDLYDPDLRIHAEDTKHKYNFTRLDMALDFLVDHQLKPYIEIGFKPNILLDTYFNYTSYEERDILFHNGKSYGTFIRSLLVHLINRYGSKEVSGWCFEQWCDPRLCPSGDPSKYFEFFEEAYQMVKALVPGVKMGGNYDRDYDVIDFENLICRWSRRNIQPDFFSLYCYPVMQEKDDTSPVNFYKQNQTILFYNLQKKRDVLLKYGMTMPLFISEWSFTVINSNALNDSCFKGAYLMQNIMEMYPYTDAMGYWFGSDLFAEGNDSPFLLNGRCGLITHQRICKPSFWAMMFMNRLESFVLAQSDHVMVTMNEYDNYVISCHNCRQLDIQYYIQEEKDITIDSIPMLYVDNKKLNLKIQINGIKNGRYHVKTRSVNTQNGSVQDEWMRMGEATFLNPRDIDYINHISRPRITIAEQIVEDHTICLDTELEAQEIQCIHLFRYVEEND